MVCLLYWSGHALETSGTETSIFVSFVFKVSFLEMDLTHLKCAVNFFFFSVLKMEPRALQIASLSVPAQLVVPVFAPSVSVCSLDK